MHLLPERHGARGAVDINSTHHLMDHPPNVDSAVFVETPHERAIGCSLTHHTKSHPRLASQYLNRKVRVQNERISHRHSSDRHRFALRWRFLHGRSLALVGGDRAAHHRGHRMASPFHWRAQEQRCLKTVTLIPPPREGPVAACPVKFRLGEAPWDQSRKRRRM